MKGRSDFREGDVIAAPLDVIAATRLSDGSRLLIKRVQFRHSYACGGCRKPINVGDLYAKCTEVTSDRCIACVDGWPLAPETVRP